MRPRGRTDTPDGVVQRERRNESVFAQPARRAIRPEGMACVEISGFGNPRASAPAPPLRLAPCDDPDGIGATGYVAARLGVGGIDAVQPDDRRSMHGGIGGSHIRVQNKVFAAAAAAETSGPG